MGFSAATTDQELVYASLEDPRAFAYLVDRYEAPLGRYIDRLGRFTREDREDVLQNTFIKIYENLNGFDVQLKFSSWAYRIAHNESISYFRRLAARPEGHLVSGDDTILFEMSGGTDLERELGERLAAEALQRALAELPSEYREVIVLHYFEHQGYDEISDILELPPGTVATRLRRGKERLRVLLIADGNT